MKALSLYELNSLVRLSLENTMCDEYWIHAEINELRVNRHCYIEFAQKDDLSNHVIAKARATIWSNNWPLISAYFEKATGQTLSAGMNVLVKVQVSFHELYGYSLNVTDIDPTYTLGDIARRRQEILDTLKAEGVDTMNKELRMPELLKRVAVISAEGAAGYGDFLNQLNSNDKGLAFQTKLFPAVMQGKNTEPTIIAALEAIADDIDSWDVVVIIRGGGATTDLSGFDTLALAENVAQFPLPIITGIGHERDYTILDLISHTRVKTPTAAAEYIIHHQEQQLDKVEQFADAISKTALSVIEREKTRLTLVTNKLPTVFTSFKVRETARIDRLLDNISSNAHTSVHTETARVDMLSQRLTLLVANQTDREREKINTFSRIINNADPIRILRLGYSITKHNGKVITSYSQVSKGDTIETTLADGTIKSTAQ